MGRDESGKVHVAAINIADGRWTFGFKLYRVDK
jgi:hypothetical protein